MIAFLVTAQPRKVKNGGRTAGPKSFHEKKKRPTRRTRSPRQGTSSIVRDPHDPRDPEWEPDYNTVHATLMRTGRLSVVSSDDESGDSTN